MDNNGTYVKALVKASLSALFAIGVKSPEYVERFAVAFQNALEKNLASLPQPQEVVPPSVVPVPEVTGSPRTADDMKADISLIIENTMIQKALRESGITTIDQLITRGQQEDYATIKGIGDKSQQEIRAALDKYIDNKK